MRLKHKLKTVLNVQKTRLRRERKKNCLVFWGRILALTFLVFKISAFLWTFLTDIIIFFLLLLIPKHPYTDGTRCRRIETRPKTFCFSFSRIAISRNRKKRVENGWEKNSKCKKEASNLRICFVLNAQKALTEREEKKKVSFPSPFVKE